MTVRILTGDCREVLRTLPDQSVHCCVTSPPYFGLRDYGHAGQIGLEPTPEKYVDELVTIFSEMRRVLRSDGTFWLNVQDGYSAGGFGGGGSWGAKPEWQTIINRTGFKGAPDGWKRKELLGLPGLLAAALSASGWYLRSEIIWAKHTASEPPRSDRPAKAHEYIFLLSKSATYAYERHPESALSVWHITTGTDSSGHIAAMPPELAERCIKAGCPRGGTVLDPFGGAGTTGLVADRLQRSSVLIELNPEYAAMASRRIHDDAPLFAEAAE
jgi:DNA modification methylase